MEPSQKVRLWMMTAREMKMRQPEMVRVRMRGRALMSPLRIMRMREVIRWPHPFERDFDPARWRRRFLGWVIKGSRSPFNMMSPRFFTPPKQI